MCRMSASFPWVWYSPSPCWSITPRRAASPVRDRRQRSTAGVATARANWRLRPTAALPKRPLRGSEKPPPSGFSPVAQRFLCATNWRTVSRPAAPLSLSNDELPNIIGKRGKECTAVWMWIRDTRRKFVHVAEVPSLLVETDLDWHVRFERVL